MSDKSVNIRIGLKSVNSGLEVCNDRKSTLLLYDEISPLYLDAIDARKAVILNRLKNDTDKK